MARSAARRRGRVRLALLAAGVVALTGILVRTSATWTDQFRTGAEGPTGGPLTSSSFGIEQRTVGADGEVGAWVGGGDADPVSELPFGRAATRISPGDHVVAGLEVRARAGSLGGTFRVTPAGVGTASALESGVGLAQLTGLHLRDVLRIRIVSVPAPRSDSPSCSPATFSSPAATTISDGLLDGGAPSGPVRIPAAGGAGVLLCFEATVPETTQDLLPMQGSLAARWNIRAVSGE